MSSAKRKLQYALFDNFTVASGKTVTKGQAVIHSGSDVAIEDSAGSSDLIIGVATVSGVAGDRVDVMLFGNAIIPVTVGTGGATRGKRAKAVSDGFTDAPTAAAGNTTTPVYGQFMNSGTAGEIVGLLVTGGSSRESA